MRISAQGSIINVTAAAAGSLLPQYGGSTQYVTSGGLALSAGADIGSAQVFLANGTELRNPNFAAMAEAAERFRAVLLATPGCVVQRVAPAVPQRDGVEWSNLLIAAPSFRHGHVETFVVPGRVSVLHVCLFPQLDDPAPIYGFDMVAGPARVTGIFLDLSPVVPGATVPRLPDIVGSTQLAGFTEARTLPTWGDVFSPDMLAVRPTDVTEVVRAIGLAE